jgi:hypothetical protein
MEKTMRKWLLILLVVIFISACSLIDEVDDLALFATPTPTQAVTATPSVPPEVHKGIAVSLRIRGLTNSTPEVETGSTVTLEQTFEPQILTVTRKADGSVYSYSTTAWANAPVTHMRTCLDLDGRGCTPGAWQPFQKTVSSEVKVDWLGERNLKLVAEFRDANQAAIPGMPGMYGSSPAAGTAVLNVSGVVLPGTLLDKLPSPVLTAVAATRTSAPPVTGSVLIKDGSCCAGGTAGSTISLDVAFKASSPAGKVTEMRVQTGGGCQKNAPALTTPWEPFQETKTYQTRLTINWVGWYISVQYRDSAGNISLVYCDDISLEGNPVPPTAKSP